MYIRREGRDFQSSVYLDHQPPLNPSVSSGTGLAARALHERGALIELAEVAGLSIRHLGRLFKAATGLTPLAY